MLGVSDELCTGARRRTCSSNTAAKRFTALCISVGASCPPSWSKHSRRIGSRATARSAAFRHAGWLTATASEACHAQATTGTPRPDVGLGGRHNKPRRDHKLTYITQPVGCLHQRCEWLQGLHGAHKLLRRDQTTRTHGARVSGTACDHSSQGEAADSRILMGPARGGQNRVRRATITESSVHSRQRRNDISMELEGPPPSRPSPTLTASGRLAPRTSESTGTGTMQGTKDLPTSQTAQRPLSDENESNPYHTLQARRLKNPGVDACPWCTACHAR